MNSHDTIDKFLNGTLSSDEMSSFLDSVEHDPDLQALLESDRIINSAVGKEKSILMNHDLSSVAGSFVAGLAASSATATIGMQTAAYAKKAGMSWITLTASTILSVSLSAGAYWYIHSSEKQQPIIPIRDNIGISFDESPNELTITVPAQVSDKPEAPKVVQRKQQTQTVHTITQQEQQLLTEKPAKIRLEHSSSKYRPKVQE